MSKRTPKNPKNWQNTHVVLCWHEKFFQSNKRQWISFCPQRWTFPTETIRLVVRSFGLWEAYPQTCPKWEFFFYHGMLRPLHDSMPSFMNFRQALDLLEFKNQVSQCLRPSDRGRVFDIHSHFLHGISMQPRTNIWFCNPFLWTEHVHVVKFWIY